LSSKEEKIPMTDVMILKNIFAKKIGEKISVFDSKQRRIMKKIIIHWFLRKMAIFLPKIGKNRRKLSS
jgi:hypothetical protein